MSLIWAPLYDQKYNYLSNYGYSGLMCQPQKLKRVICPDFAYWFTPPVASGLLAGTLREELLESGKLTPRVLRLEELKSVQDLALVNGVRGWRKASWV